MYVIRHYHIIVYVITAMVKMVKRVFYKFSRLYYFKHATTKASVEQTVDCLQLQSF